MCVLRRLKVHILRYITRPALAGVDGARLRESSDVGQAGWRPSMNGRAATLKDDGTHGQRAVSFNHHQSEPRLPCRRSVARRKASRSRKLNRRNGSLASITLQGLCSLFLHDVAGMGTLITLAS